MLLGAMQRRVVAGFLALVTLCACDRGGDVREDPGDGRRGLARIPDAPRDVTTCRYQMDALLPPPWEGDEEPRVHVEAYRCPDEALLRVERVVGEESNGRLRFEWVADVVAAPLDSGETFVMLYCRRGGEDDSNIVAIAEAEDAPQLTRIRKAWLVNPVSAEVGDLASTDVTCANEAYGV